MNDGQQTLSQREDVEEAIAALKAADSVLASVIARVGPFELERRGPSFAALLRAIVFQQLSGRAANAILRRLLAPYGDEVPTPLQLLATPDSDLRQVGLSERKAQYLKGLAAAFVENVIDEEELPSLSDEEVIAALTQLKGIGRWSAEMFLIFCLGRLNVLPLGDLGFRKAVGIVYGLGAIPTPDRVRELAARWEPYRSIATWYLWRSQIAAPLPVWTSADARAAGS